MHSIRGLNGRRVIDAGDRVAVIFVARGRGRESGAEVEMRWGSVWTVPGGRIVRMDAYVITPEAALEAVGLPVKPI
jgi:ketosteroid isomerase-like protein